MEYNRAENTVSQINTNVFFREFTFSKNNFKALDSKQQLEFADNVVWLDDLFFIFQIKERDQDHSLDDKKWYQNKVINKGVKQIKSTLKYLSSYSDIYIENEKGHKLDISKAKEANHIRKIIIYSPSENFPEELRFLRFYESSEIGLIHLFHSEDYYWVCKYLRTPAEVDEYLEFREEFYIFNPQRSNLLPEQYLLAHFLETLVVDHYNPQYISNLDINNDEIEQFDISPFIINFSKNITLIDNETQYYPIIKEISKLNRAELYEFKTRILKSIEICEERDLVVPYRIFVPRTSCAFIFIPLHSSKAQFWKGALNNFTLAHKYIMKAPKCIGVVTFRDPSDSQCFQLFWEYVESEWEYDKEMETILKDSPPPFRDTQLKRVENRYK